jgi:tetratricopeptide (TPR) repeat protein
MTSHAGRFAVSALALGVLVCGRTVVRATDDISAAGLLDTYIGGRFDEAVATAAAIDDADDVRAAIEREAPAWIEAVPSDAARRQLAVAAFALEVTHARMERDWRKLWSILEWSCDLLRRSGPPTDRERTWHLAAIAVAGRARDFGRLVVDRPPPWTTAPARSLDIPTLRRYAGTTGHLGHMLQRFPDEPRVLFATALLAVAPFEGEATRNPSRAMTTDHAAMQQQGRLRALAFLNALRADPRLEAEAHVRAGHIHYAMGSYSSALGLERLAQRTAADSATKYLAHLFAGRIHLALRQPPEAAREFEHAIAIAPRAQSAILALSTLQATSDTTIPSLTLLRQSLDNRDRFADPWRLFGYGDYVRWPARQAAMREALR